MAWYYKDGELEIGPVSKPELQDLINKKVITGQTLIRAEQGQDWKPLSEMAKARKNGAEVKQPPPQPAAKPPNLSSAPSAGDTVREPIGETADAATPQPLAVCSQCGRSVPGDQVLEYEGQVICAACKPMFVQRLKEGVGVAGLHHYAGFWIRFVAKFIDGIILAAVQWAIFIPLSIFSFSNATQNPEQFGSQGFFMVMGLQQLLGIAIPAVYTTFFLGKFSATPGKMACRLKVIVPEGGQMSYMRALGRNFAELLSGLILLIGYIMAAFDSEKRALHDRICSTRVVYK